MSGSASFLQRMITGTLALCALAVAGVGHAQNTPYQTIDNPPGPIKALFVGNDLSVQINHELDTTAFQIYPSGTRPADYGTLVVLDGTLYAPDFTAHPSTATFNWAHTRRSLPSISPLLPAAEPWPIRTE